MKKIIIGLVLLMLITLVGCDSTHNTGDFLEIISMQDIEVNGYPNDTTIIKCRDRESGDIIYIMQGYRKGGISVISDKTE